MEGGIVVFDGGGGIFEAIAGEDADHPGPRRHLTMALEQAGHRCRTGRFTEDAFGAAQQLVGLDDLGVGDGHEVTLAFLAGPDGVIPIHRVADADGGGDGVWLFHRLSQDKGSCSGGLETHHAGQFLAVASLLIFLESHPVGADVAGIPHGDAQPVGGIAQGVNHFEGRSFLTLKAVRIEGVDQGDRIAICHFTNDGQGPVEIAFDR